MPINKYVFLSVLFLCAGVGSFFAFSKSTKPNATVLKVPTSEFSGSGSVDRVIQIKIQPDEIANNDKTEVKIKTAITLPFDFDDILEFKWLLTENLIHTSGDLVGRLQNLKANQTQYVEITVRGFSKLENRQIAFQISGQKNGRRIFADGIISSKIESTFEDIVQNVERIKAEKKEDN